MSSASIEIIQPVANASFISTLRGKIWRWLGFDPAQAGAAEDDHAPAKLSPMDKAKERFGDAFPQSLSDLSDLRRISDAVRHQVTEMRQQVQQVTQQNKELRATIQALEKRLQTVDSKTHRQHEEIRRYLTLIDDRIEAFQKLSNKSGASTVVETDRGSIENVTPASARDAGAMRTF